MFDVSQIAAEVPVLTRFAVGLVGLLLLLAGARWYHRAVALAAFVAGTVLASAAMVIACDVLAVPIPPVVMVVVALVCGGSVAGVAKMAHRLVLLAVGAMAGGTAVAALSAHVAAVPMWGALLGMLVGALIVPWIWDQTLKILTPAVGAVAVAWAVGLPDNLLLVMGLWVFGAVAQLVGGGARAPAEEGA
jgi:hypothetical protein